MTIKNVVILGGGSAGWMSAAMLVKSLGKQLAITLVESDQIATVGVGEATIPPIGLFNRYLGIDEAEFLTQTQGTIKLGIEFENWGREGERYMHAFGELGRDLGITPFIHYWLRARQQGHGRGLWDYSLNYQAAKAGRFIPLPKVPDSPLKGLVHAYHFDAGLYAGLLRRYSEGLGVKRIEGKVVEVALDEGGAIGELVLASGQRVAGELFIDCSGQRARLIGEALGGQFEDWGHYLPADSALAVPSENTGEPRPYTRAIAHDVGWQWQIPLQHRTGNGLVYASRYLGDDEARAKLLAAIEGKALAEPRLIRFKTGRQRQQWLKNCVSLGLASGFLEPLESTSLHLVQSGITRLIKLFPRTGIAASAVAEFNRQSAEECEAIRDFIILHYHLNQRPEPFWQAMREMAVPSNLGRRLALFGDCGRVFREGAELFSEVAWQQVLIGQNLLPTDYDPLADSLDGKELEGYLANLAAIITATRDKLPRHGDFLTRARELAATKGKGLTTKG
ncbi:MAG: tryptophan halogenase family protein [Pseudomonadota bacterium]|uniref:tryptophan halogenase family protein n=1 Tax=Gallaecimonas pentaromativorans TaxID=584787 RepID=UPI00067ED37D|nr:tryptophan halogenase family protein [Gallaecimonas pentaromativorans]MED5526585.1 tryptophan halogenase family protein [Pseudomonadota bacterium]